MAVHLGIILMHSIISSNDTVPMHHLALISYTVVSMILLQQLFQNAVP